MSEQLRNKPTERADASGTDVGELQYELQNGYVQAWLVAGPIKTPVRDLEKYRGSDFKAQIARAYYRPPTLGTRSIRQRGASSRYKTPTVTPTR